MQIIENMQQNMYAFVQSEFQENNLQEEYLFNKFHTTANSL